MNILKFLIGALAIFALATGAQARSVRKNIDAQTAAREAMQRASDFNDFDFKKFSDSKVAAAQKDAERTAAEAYASDNLLPATVLTGVDENNVSAKSVSSTTTVQGGVMALRKRGGGNVCLAVGTVGRAC